MRRTRHVGRPHATILTGEQQPYSALGDALSKPWDQLRSSMDPWMMSDEAAIRRKQWRFQVNVSLEESLP